MAVIFHPIAPIWDEHSKVLILGSFPSVKSREGMFFYHHPQNRFWKTLAAVFETAVPQTIEEKKAFLLWHNIALWDSIGSCEITGSQDSSIRNVTPNDIAGLLRQTNISAIFCNGAASYDCYNRYILPQTGIEAEKLPSTSPANAAWNAERLTAAWQRVRLVQVMSEKSVQTGENLL